jgi:hypothetical protein
MNTFSRSSILLSFLSAAVMAQDSPRVGEHCPASVGPAEIAAALGPDIRIQPVFSPEGMKGWRIYGVERTEQLRTQGLGEGALITHICGIIARDVDASGGKVACKGATPCQYDVTFTIEGRERTVLIKRPEPPR